MTALVALSLVAESDLDRSSLLLERPRIHELLAQRFEKRLTTIVGAAGAGKSSALRSAIAAHQEDPSCRDLWVRVQPDDNNAHHLLITLLQATGSESGSDAASTRDHLLDWIWSQAPVHVSIAIDDAHQLQSTEARAVLKGLLADMPSNGHLVISGRTSAQVPVARWRALDQLQEVTDVDLHFDDDELAALRLLRHADSGILQGGATTTRHAATADLQLAAGSEAGIDFLWTEILDAIEPDRRRHLLRCAVVDELDNDLVNRLTDGSFDLDTLLAGVPLTDQGVDGRLRLHDLLREALTSRLSPAEHAKALAVAAQAELDRGRFDHAVSLSIEGGEHAAAIDIAKRFVMLPIMRQVTESLISVRHSIAELDPESAIAVALDAQLASAASDADGLDGFITCAERARAEHDVDLEAFATHRVIQIEYLCLLPFRAEALERLAELADQSTFASGAVAHARSIVALFSGEPLESREIVDGYEHLDAATRSVMRAQMLCDIGRPEDVGVGLDPDDLASFPPGAEIYVAFAMWLRGEAPPELAESIVADMIPVVLRRGWVMPSVSILGVGTAIAAAAGRPDLARQRADQAALLAEQSRVGMARIAAQIAQATAAACNDTDEVAAAILTPRSSDETITAWPRRDHMLALPLIYLTRPEARAALDQCDFGPSLRTAVAAGQALVALGAATTEAARTAARAAAADLPWPQRELLRAHVLPHHLIELACAAAAHDSTATTAPLSLLQEIPNRQNRLRLLLDHGDESIAAVARDVLGTGSATPPPAISIKMLGPITLIRDGSRVADPEWSKRPKLREALALLAERQRIHRGEVCALLWPGHDDDRKAANNLRSIVSMLQSVLEPDRPREAPGILLQAEHDHLTLDAGVQRDIDRFESLVTAAQTDDRAGFPAHALESYQNAVALYSGDYLSGVTAEWVVLERVRLRSLAVGAARRIADLTSARGDHETAVAMAHRAVEIDGDSEPAITTLQATLRAASEVTD